MSQQAPIKSFKTQLKRTYIFISIQFFVTIFIGIMTLIGISYLAKEHLKQVGPLVTTINQLVKGVSDTMLLLDEWMLTGPKENKIKREEIWDSIIYPITRQLHVQLKDNNNDNISLLQDLQHLQTEQWIIEDMAHTQGNNQALNLYLVDINDIERKILSVITQIMHVVSSVHGDKLKDPKTLSLFSHSADIRGSFSLASTNLLQFILTGAEECEKNFQKNFATAKNSLTNFKQSHNLSQEEINMVNTLITLFSRYTYQTEKAMQLRYSPKWNLAIYNYIHVLEPLQKRVTSELNLILENKTEKLRESSTRLMEVGHLVILLSTLLGASTASLLILRARRDIRLAGRLEENIHNHTNQLKELSRTDQLTKLYNRRAMISILNQELNTALINNTPLSFVYFDVDKFKHINDTQGHIVGDQILQKVAHALRTSIRKSDFPCRYGGDEFCIILPGCIRENAKKVCDQLITAFRKEAPGVSLSIGITEVSPSEKIEPEELIKRTDQKMYLGKKKNGFQINC
ncbi:MAG: GGDEF domain-containing protein [Candidatus Electrothrix scaldis]|nr:MAG: GGDEF domain-containing protein [Candidatus Electrothrix sp. GW3-3]